MELQDQWGVSSLHGTRFTTASSLATHSPTTSLHCDKLLFQHHCWILSLFSWGRVRGTPQYHRKREQVGRQKSQTRAVLTALSPSPAGSDSAISAWEPVEPLVWILCLVCDGACRAGSGFHRHHLYPGLPLVPLSAEALSAGTPSERPG